MGKLSRFKIPGYAERMENIRNGVSKIRDIYNKHIMEGYPKMEEDSEGIAYWENPKLVKMMFKGLTPQQGLAKTIDKFNKVKMLKYVKCYINDGYVVVELP